MPHFDINYIISKQGKESKYSFPCYHSIPIRHIYSLFSFINPHSAYDSDLYHRQDVLLIAIFVIYSYWADGYVELTTCTVAHIV